MDDKVAVLLGGNSSERNISIKSGYTVLKGLCDAGIDAYPVDIKYFPIVKLKEAGYKKVFIALHGRNGEDGKVQGVLDFLGLPYTGSGVLASSLSMDKLRTKQLWAGIGLPIVPYVTLKKQQLLQISDKILFESIYHLGLPLIVKPILEGSSIGISKIINLSELRLGLNFAFNYNEDIIIEKYINGTEYTVGIIGNEILPPIKIKPINNFYDYNAKYLCNKTQYFCPCGLLKIQEEKLNNLALSAYNAIGCTGWGRIDIMMDINEIFYLLEINTSPGMTYNSLVPMAAKELGINFPQLVKKILYLNK